MRTYLDTFARFRERPIIAQVESLTQNYRQLDNFERAQLGMQLPVFSPTPFFQRANNFDFLATLCPGDAEEAKGLIPSLQDKISDDDLNDLVNDITSARHQ
jgi:DNA-directed RNA polymerase II subunit RPB4